MDTCGGEGDRAAVAALDRHDQRRRCGVPTISVLVGPIEPSQRLARRWVEASYRPVVLIGPGPPDPETVVVPWVNRLAAEGNLAKAAAEWLARRLDRPADSLIGSLVRRHLTKGGCSSNRPCRWFPKPESSWWAVG